jgi:hypothetical protein
MDNHYNPYEDYDEIIHPNYRDSMNNPDNPVVYIDSMSDEELTDSTSSAICLISTTLLLATVIIVYYFTH